MTTIGPTLINPSAGWVQVSTAAVIVQNLGPGDVWLKIDTAQPGATDRGIRLGPQCNSDTNGVIDNINGFTWVRAITDTEIVVVE